MARRAFLVIHLWVALTLCVPLIVLGLTGSVLVFQHEIDTVVDPLPAYARANGPLHTREAIVDAARAAAPPGTRERAYVPPGPDDVAVATFSARGNPAAGTTEVAIDGRSLRIIRARRTSDSALRFIHRIHENLAIGAPGRAIVGGLGVAMLVLGGSGLTMWFGRRMVRIRKGLRGFSFYRDLHTTLGFWSLVAFVAVSATGVCLAFPQLFPHASDGTGPMAIIRPIHTGALGSPWKIVVALVGLLPLAFAISGIAMWRTRYATRASAATFSDAR